LELVLRFLKEKKYIFVRVEPLQNISNIHYPISIIGTRQPQHTLLLDISKSEEDLLSEMHAKTRYNIRLSEKKGVEVRQEKDVDTFWRLNEETSARDAFKTHDREYYARMLDLPSVFQLNAYYEGVSIASHIFVRFGDRFTYLHGASGNTHRNLMAPYLLQWEGIRFAEELGCQEYDFWGIAPPVSEGEKNKKTCFHELCWEVHHPWTGITRFKAGFGGKVWAYPEAVDIVLDAWQYRLYRFASYIQRYRAV
jgi:lipid II:glycine glycyltransferase (peptidoglycan interpeptide bridge formation enzyme)